MEIQNFMKYKHKDCLFYIKNSNICNGLGIFAKKDIQMNVYITWYYGYTSRDFKISKKNRYKIGYKSNRCKNIILVGVKDINKLSFKGAAQLANDAICYDISKKTNNTIFIQIGKYMFLKSTRYINKNDEILVSYGIDYWNNQINIFKKEYDINFKFVINIISYLINVIEKCIKTEIYEYLGLFENIVKFSIMKKNRWCIISNIYHTDDNFHLILEKKDKVNIYYKCETCNKKPIFIE
jgi:hypothetical protein